MLPRCNLCVLLQLFGIRVFNIRTSIAWAFIVLILIPASFAFSMETASLNHIPGLIGFYQVYISPVDGDRCPMVPSCSTYIKNSVKKHGVFMGWIMGMDRLVRCGRDEVKTSSPLWINGKKYIYDPVENNDFWWSNK
ncbi:Haemolytic domain-containing protein [Desulfobacula phenolica]|uniref:Haemolytic domain-containing protein n=1 Tax=Desulfobacula phenolica TaxID=90732 RepID=A0A1H2DNV9_9BACT|nr:Haemolytic domain-containing protein [Desulfobacula phenolica]